MIEEMSMFYPLFMFYLSAIEDYGLEIVIRNTHKVIVTLCVCVFVSSLGSASWATSCLAGPAAQRLALCERLVPLGH